MPVPGTPPVIPDPSSFTRQRLTQEWACGASQGGEPLNFKTHPMYKKPIRKCLIDPNLYKAHTENKRLATSQNLQHQSLREVPKTLTPSRQDQDLMGVNHFILHYNFPSVLHDAPCRRQQPRAKQCEPKSVLRTRRQRFVRFRIVFAKLRHWSFLNSFILRLPYIPD